MRTLAKMTGSRKSGGGGGGGGGFFSVSEVHRKCLKREGVEGNKQTKTNKRGRGKKKKEEEEDLGMCGHNSQEELS